jgi:alpha,alpha-trehalase
MALIDPRAAAAVVGLLLLSGRAFALVTDSPAPPSIEFGELYRAVEMSGVFVDQKTFADAIPRQPPAEIRAAYEEEKGAPGFDLKAFVGRHFAPPRSHPDAFHQHMDWSLRDYIHRAWEALRRHPDEASAYSSLLPLNRSYIAPGGRFREIYYWDSYFTMLGLEQDGRRDIGRDMLDNIASLIDRYGHMPNGNRSYYLSRSQPPFFAAMVELVAGFDGDRILTDHLPQMQAEYDFWMDGADGLAPGSAHRRIVRLIDGTLFNRYWDDRAEPRDESYRQDVETAGRSPRPAAEVYRDVRAGAESGWDFSSRWLADGHDLATIRTTDIAPVDLNALMANLEETLSRTYRVKGDAGAAERYRARAAARRAAIRRLMWNAEGGFFADLLWRDGRQSEALTAATVYPLYFGIATDDEARAVAATLRAKLLAPGGLRTTLQTTGQQWDQPNGWAPLQYLAIEGLRKFGEADLAHEIAERWIRRNAQGYADMGVLVEKYDVERSQETHGEMGGSGGEYTLQVGFGWTNGVLAKLFAEYPDISGEATRPKP